VTADEVVALYDPDDVAGRVVGSAPRAAVRAQNLPHAATAVLVRRGDGAWFVHRRADTKDLWPGAHDCAAGGVILAGESPDDAARRELAEELGIEGVELRRLLTAWYRGPDRACQENRCSCGWAATTASTTRCRASLRIASR